MQTFSKEENEEALKKFSHKLDVTKDLLYTDVLLEVSFTICRDRSMALRARKEKLRVGKLSVFLLKRKVNKINYREMFESRDMTHR